MIDKHKIEQSFEDIQTLFFRLTTVINYWNDENYLRAVDWLQNLDTVRYDLFQNNSHYHHHHHPNTHPNFTYTSSVSLLL